MDSVRRLALGLLRDTGGDAEPIGDHGVAAVFDDPTMALEAAGRLHRPSTEVPTGTACAQGVTSGIWR